MYTCVIRAKSREVKQDDIYIYNMYTLSLLLATFQIKQRRGRLCFQEGEDDEDMEAIVTPTAPTSIPIGLISIDHTRKLYYHVLSFLGHVFEVHENMMMRNFDTFFTYN